jgi:hypothetical protein
VIQSGVFHLDDHPAGQLEAAIAGWIGKDDGYICQSGYTANLGLIQVVADPQTPVYLDMLAHMSLWEGARASGARHPPVSPQRPGTLCPDGGTPRAGAGGGGLRVQHDRRAVPAGRYRGRRGASWLHGAGG